MTKQEILKDIFEQVKKIMTTTLGDYNDDLLRDQVYKETVNILEHSSWSDQLANYHITCDRTNNTPIAIDRGEFRLDVYLKLKQEFVYRCLICSSHKTAVAL